MYRFLIALIFTGIAISQTAPESLLVSRQFGITSAAQVFDNRSIQRQCTAFGFLVAVYSNTWSAQLEYSDISVNGPWTVFPTGAVSNANSVYVAGGYGYHLWVRINTTSGTTTSTLSCVKDFYMPGGNGGGSGSGTVTLLNGSASINPGSIQDGNLSTLGTSIGVSGAAIGDATQVYTNTPLPSGVRMFADVTSPNTLRVRLMNLSGATYSPGSLTVGATVIHYSPSGGGAGIPIIGFATFSPGVIQDGTMPILGTTVTVTGASIGDLTYVGTDGSLPSGIRVFGDVTSTNTVTLRMMNLSGSVYSPGMSVFNIVVWH